MVIFVSLVLAAAQVTQSRAGLIVNARGAGVLTCATAFMPGNRNSAENWIAGNWTGWDMAQINVADPVAPNADLNGIVGEVEKVCREEPATTLLQAVLVARKAVQTRSSGTQR